MEFDGLLSQRPKGKVGKYDLMCVFPGSTGNVRVPRLMGPVRRVWSEVALVCGHDACVQVGPKNVLLVNFG